MSLNQLIYAAISDRGTPIDACNRSLMEDCFQSSFRDVRLHFSPPSNAANRALGSLAFTVENHICFTSWFDNSFGRQFTYVLAHELSHVMQKRYGWQCCRHLRSIASERMLELEANRNAENVLKGKPVTIISPDPSEHPRRYGRAGHYYTAFYTAMAAGFQAPVANDIALFTQLPDLVAELDAVPAGYRWKDDAIKLLQHLDPDEELLIADDMTKCWQIEAGLHALTGGSSQLETTYRAEIIRRFDAGTLAFGLGVHSFGDSFAHRILQHEDQMYGAPIGHGVEIINRSKIEGVDEHDPDKIEKRPSLFLDYGKQLFELFTQKSPTSGRISLSQYIATLTEVSLIQNEEDQIALLLSNINNSFTDAPAVIYRPPNECVEWEVFRTQAEHLHLNPADLIYALEYAAIWAGVNASTLTLHVNWGLQWRNYGAPLVRQIGGQLIRTNPITYILSGN